MSSLERGYLPLGVGPQVRPVLSYHKWGQLVFRRANKFEILYGTPYEGDSFLQRIISNKEKVEAHRVINKGGLALPS